MLNNEEAEEGPIVNLWKKMKLAHCKPTSPPQPVSNPPATKIAAAKGKRAATGPAQTCGPQACRNSRQTSRIHQGQSPTAAEPRLHPRATRHTMLQTLGAKNYHVPHVAQSEQLRSCIHRRPPYVSLSQRSRVRSSTTAQLHARDTQSAVQCHFIAARRRITRVVQNQGSNDTVGINCARTSLTTPLAQSMVAEAGSGRMQVPGTILINNG